MTEREIFFEAIELTSADARAAYLQGACGKDVTLRRKVEELLKEHFANDSLLSKPAVDGTSTVLSDTQITEGPGAQIGRYKLLQKLGEGGFGVVYMAEQKEPVKRRVALKIIKLGMDTGQVVARFEAERQALAMMDHPNIAKVLDAGATDTGRPYFVMELVKGVPITRYCDDNSLTTQERLELFIPVCQAIQHAHQKGIIHRDIKPSNVMVTLHDGVPVPKVIDFGIAKATQQELTEKTIFTQYSQFIGTPAYMSPEQAEMSGLDIDTRSDIYSLGVLLYELLVGRTPLDGKELMSGGYDEIRRRIKEEEPPKPSTRVNTLEGSEKTTVARHRKVGPEQLSSELRGDLDWIVLKALEKDRTRRYETANGFALDIKRFLENQPVAAVPPSSGYLLKKYARRHRGALAVAAAIIGLLVAGITASTWLAVRAKRAQEAAEKAQAAALEQKLLAQTEQKKAETQQQRADAEKQKASESEQQSRRFLYASDMNLAQQSLNLANLGRARRLLEQHRPKPGEEDLRGWEWRYLWQQTRSRALVTLTNRLDRGYAVSFSPDGSRLAVGWGDGRVDLWNVPGQRLIRALTDGGYLHAGRVVFSPVRNLLAATSEPKVVSLYDLDTGRESILWRAPDQGEWEVRDLSFSQDGSRLVIYAGSTERNPELGDKVWVVNVSSAQIEREHRTLHSKSLHFGAARLSPDNRRLYLARSDALHYRYSIQCLDVATGQQLWQTDPQRDYGLTNLAISPDGRLLASGSGYEDATIRVWNAATGELVRQLPGHAVWVNDLVFTRDGRRLISVGGDQSIRFWDTSDWKETNVLRGHTDAVHAVAISETQQLVASAGKDGDLLLWRDEETSAKDGYRRLPENLGKDEVLPLDHSRVLLLPPGQPPELIDLKRDALRVSLPALGSSTNVLGWFGTNTLCHWNGTNQVIVSELRGAEVVQRGTITLDSANRPNGFAYNPKRQTLAWTEGASSGSVFLASLAAPGRRIELKGNAPGPVPFRFSEDGKFLVALGEGSVLAWNVETGQIVVPIVGSVWQATFAAGGRALVAVIAKGWDHEVVFYDLVHPERAPRRAPMGDFSGALAFSPDGALVALGTMGGLVRLFDSAKGESSGDLHRNLAAVFGLAFSPDGRRLASTSTAWEAVKLWDVGTRQELLTLGGTGSWLNGARWSAEGDVILAGPPWQAWRAPSWEEIAAAEAKEPPSSDIGRQGKAEGE